MGTLLDVRNLETRFKVRKGFVYAVNGVSFSLDKGEMLGVEDVKEILAVALLGVIPESQAVLKASNQGVPVILDDQSDAGQAYSDAVDRLLGKTVEHRFLDVQKKGFFERLFGGN